MPTRSKAKVRALRVNTSFYTLQEVAEVLRVSVSTVRRAVKAGELDVTRVGTLGQIRVSQQALDRYVERSTSNPARKHADASASIQAADTSSVRELAGTAPNGVEWRISNG